MQEQGSRPLRFALGVANMRTAEQCPEQRSFPRLGCPGGESFATFPSLLDFRYWKVFQGSQHRLDDEPGFVAIIGYRATCSGVWRKSRRAYSRSFSRHQDYMPTKCQITCCRRMILAIESPSAVGVNWTHIARLLGYCFCSIWGPVCSYSQRPGSDWIASGTVP